uniref:Uncharacterized protein n=1 Tax=Aegilops tauschii subsp. strangulata TaxID=200361 RepID=A0A453LNV1_AEGTS
MRLSKTSIPCSVPFTEENASSLVKHATKFIIPTMFKLVLWSINAGSKCVIREVLDAS